MPLETLIALLGMLVFAAASFFFALAESALFSLGKWRVQQFAAREPQRWDLVERLLLAPQDLLATIVLGNTLANGAMIAMALAMALFFGHWPFWPTAGGLLLVLLLLCEVLPKTLAVRRPEAWAPRVARLMRFFLDLSAPVRKLAQGIDALLLNLFIPAAIKPQTTLTDEEYQELLEMACQQGALAVTEKEIIVQIIHLDRRTVGEVMRPRSQMASLSDNLPVEEMIAVARRHPYRRLPIYDETPDTIVGVLNTRLLLADPEVDLADVVEFPSFVPESMNLLQLLKSFQRRRHTMAIVLDEYGATAGLVTLEDILHELFGEFHREGEAEGFVMEKLGAGRWRVSGTMLLEDFQREYPALGAVAGVVTMGGLAAVLAEVVPTVGDVLSHRGLKLTVQAADERRVKELLVEAVPR